MVDNHLGRGSLARTANRDVADTDDWNVELLALENADIEEEMPETHPPFEKTSRYFL